MTHKEQELETALLAILGDFKTGQIDFKQAVKEINQAASYHKESPTTADASVLINQLKGLCREYSDRIKKYKEFSDTAFQNMDQKSANKWMNKMEEIDRVAKDINTLLAQYSAQSLPADELVWKEGKTLVFDHTVLFSKSYNFEGLELMAQEAKTPIGRVVIWPDKLGGNKKWAFYFEYDGCLKQDFDSEGDIKKAVNEEVKTKFAALSREQSLPESQESKTVEGDR